MVPSCLPHNVTDRRRAEEGRPGKGPGGTGELELPVSWRRHRFCSQATPGMMGQAQPLLLVCWERHSFCLQEAPSLVGQVTPLALEDHPVLQRR